MLRPLVIFVSTVFASARLAPRPIRQVGKSIRSNLVVTILPRWGEVGCLGGWISPPVSLILTLGFAVSTSWNR